MMALLHPDDSTLHTGKIYYFPLHISIFVLLLLRQHRGSAATTSGVAGIGLGAPG
jgi:hypothetical protein